MSASGAQRTHRASALGPRGGRTREFRAADGNSSPPRGVSFAPGDAGQNMTLSDAASVAGIISSAAVALSLVYLALQVRQAERNQKAMMQQGRADRTTDLMMRIADPLLQ